MEKIKLLFVAIFFFLLCGPVLDVQASGKKGKKRKETTSSLVAQNTEKAEKNLVQPNVSTHNVSDSAIARGDFERGDFEKGSLERLIRENTKLKKKLTESQKGLAAVHKANLSYQKDLDIERKARNLAQTTLSQAEMLLRSKEAELGKEKDMFQKDLAKRLTVVHNELEMARNELRIERASRHKSEQALLQVQEQLKSKSAELENFKKVENFFLTHDE